MTATSALAQPPNLLKLLAHDLRFQIMAALSHSDHRVHELVQLLDQPMNLVSYHLKQLREERLVTDRRSSADGRDVYYSLDLDALRLRYLAAGAALHPALTIANTSTLASPDEGAHAPARILFLCTHNSARSQMAEGILRHLGAGRVATFSAGSQPADVHPDAVRVLAAIGIDISQQRPKHLDEFTDQSFDYIITVCDRVREVCPRFPNDPEQIHWSFADPAAVQDDSAREHAFQQIAQQLVRRSRNLLTLLDRQRQGNT